MASSAVTTPLPMISFLNSCVSLRYLLRWNHEDSMGTRADPIFAINSTQTDPSPWRISLPCRWTQPPTSNKPQPTKWQQRGSSKSRRTPNITTVSSRRATTSSLWSSNQAELSATTSFPSSTTWTNMQAPFSQLNPQCATGLSRPSQHLLPNAYRSNTGDKLLFSSSKPRGGE